MSYFATPLKILGLAYALYFFYYYGLGFGIGQQFHDIKVGRCRVIPGINCGSEKISLTKDGLAFITNGMNLITKCNLHYLRGKLYIFDFNFPDNNATELNIYGSSFNQSNFYPHGMDIFEIDDRRVIVYVVNHANKEETIEVFSYQRNRKYDLVHLQTLRDEKFVCLNDIALIDENSFYATNYFKFCHARPKLLAVVEFLLRLPFGNIIYYSKGNTKIVSKQGECLINGITLSKDHNRLLAANWMHSELLVYNIDSISHDLSEPIRHSINIHGDNIFLEKSSNILYVAGTKSIICANYLAVNATTHCESAATKITPHNESWNDIMIEDFLYRNSKDFVSVSSTIVFYKGKYLIGTVFDKLAYCHKKCYDK